MSSDQNPQFRVLLNAISFVANEPLVLAQYEATANPGKFTQLWSENDEKEFDKSVNRVIQHLGGPPEIYFLREDQEPPPADNYPEAAMSEVFAVFSRARNSVMRAHLFETGSSLLAAHPDLLDFPDTPEAQAIFAKQAENAFWEHAEAAYIRMSAFWDRIGQVLDFAFFNIRKFDQNGFTSVMDRIRTNAVPMNNRFEKSSSWLRLRSFQTSEKEDGLKWLLRRRNLVVHSLHLHPIPADENSVFKSQFNHLEDAHRERLCPRAPADEVEILIEQLNKAGNLFKDFLTIVEFAPSRKTNT